MTDRLAQALHQERSELVLALSGHPVNAAMGWQILHRWDALVEIAKAARETLADHTLPERDSPNRRRLRAALSVLDDREAGEPRD